MRTNGEAIKTLIVDDESLARKRIRDLLRGRNEFEIIGECADGAKAVESIEKMSPDLLFLDIQMPDMDGFQVLDNLQNLPTTIFVTAYDKYALKAFEVHAVDYLLKPFDDERFEEMLEYVGKQIKRNQTEDLSEKLNALLANFHHLEARKSTEYQTRLVLKSTGRINFIEIKNIDWIEAEGSYISLKVGGKSHLLRGTLKSLEEILNPDIFLRIHRSTIVNVNQIKELQPHFHGEFVVILKDGKRLKLSRNYREQAEKLLGGQF